MHWEQLLAKIDWVALKDLWAPLFLGWFCV